MWIESLSLRSKRLPISIQILMFSESDLNKFTKEYIIPSSGGTISKYDEAIYDSGVYPSESAQTLRGKLPTGFKTKIFYVIIKQGANDTKFLGFFEIVIISKTEANNYL